MEAKDNHLIASGSALLFNPWMGSSSSVEQLKTLRLGLWRRMAGIQTQSLTPEDSLSISQKLSSDCFQGLIMQPFCFSHFSACLAFGHFTYHPQTLELSLDRNYQIWCRISFSLQLSFLECFLSPTFSLPLNRCWLLGSPTKWCWPLNHCVCGRFLTGTTQPHKHVGPTFGLVVPEELFYRISKSIHAKRCLSCHIKVCRALRM